jgi:hypothetical protein
MVVANGGYLFAQRLMSLLAARTQKQSSKSGLSITSKVRAELYQEEVQVMSTWSQVPVAVKSFSSEDGSLVIIGTNSHNVNALLVSWTNGVAYRRGLANIKESDWTQLRQRIWKPILLA